MIVVVLEFERGGRAPGKVPGLIRLDWDAPVIEILAPPAAFPAPLLLSLGPRQHVKGECVIQAMLAERAEGIGQRHCRPIADFDFGSERLGGGFFSRC